MDNSASKEELSSEQPESIFNEHDFEMQGYDKHIRQARNAIFAGAIVIFINLLILIAGNNSNEYLWIDILLWSLFILGFTLLGLWTKKKPYSAIVGALILYAVFIGLNAVIDISSIFKGIIFKIIVIVFLIKGINDARQAQEMQKHFSK